MNQMNNEVTIKQNIVQRPFEARLISDELRARVIYFQKLLNKKRSKSTVEKINKNKNH